MIAKIKRYLSSMLGLKPGDFQRRPRIYDALYLLHSSQLRLLKEFIRENLSYSRDITVLDIGCGNRPYEELFAPYTGRYIGNDVNAGPGVDIVSSAENIDLPDESCDAVLLLQTLEHVNDPLKVLTEVNRLLTKEGYAFITIPACFCYHPGIEKYVPGKEATNPIYPDYWRWTQAGIKKLISENFSYEKIDVQNIGGFFQGFGLQFAFLMVESAKAINKYLSYLVIFTVVPVVNILSLCLDKIFFKWNRLWCPYTVFLGFAITLKKLQITSKK